MTTTVLFCQQQTNPHVHIPFLSITPISSSCFHNLCYFLWFHLFFPLFYLCLLLNSSLHFHSFCLPPSPRSLISIFAILCLFPSSSSNISSLFFSYSIPPAPIFLTLFLCLTYLHFHFHSFLSSSCATVNFFFYKWILKKIHSLHSSPLSRLSLRDEWGDSLVLAPGGERGMPDLLFTLTHNHAHAHILRHCC